MGFPCCLEPGGFENIMHTATLSRANLLEAFAQLAAREAAFNQFGLVYEDDGQTVIITEGRALNGDEARGHKIVAEMPSVFGNLLADAIAGYEEPTSEEVALLRAELGL